MFSIIGSILGFASSTAPAILDHFKAKQEYSHQLKMLEAQAKYNLKSEEAKAVTAEIAGVYAHSETIQSRASLWSVTLSSTVRPITTYMIILLWLSVKLLAVIQLYMDGGELHKVMDTIFNQYDSGLMSAVICYWYGSRSIEKLRYSRKKK